MSGKSVLLDSNIIIYIQKGRLGIEKVLQNYSKFYISVITYIEVMGFLYKKEEDKRIMRNLLENFKIINLSDAIIEKTIQIRTNNRVKLPDAIIAATAIEKNCMLLTANLKDFINIPSIKVQDPFTIQ